MVTYTGKRPTMAEIRGALSSAAKAGNQTARRVLAAKAPAPANSNFEARLFALDQRIARMKRAPGAGQAPPAPGAPKPTATRPPKETTMNLSTEDRAELLRAAVCMSKPETAWRARQLLKKALPAGEYERHENRWRVMGFASPEPAVRREGDTMIFSAVGVRRR
jgi:hypothetical protein